MANIKLEFVVRMTCKSCEEDVKRVLQGQEGIVSVFADHGSERVIVDTNLNSSKVQQLIESTGKQAVLQGVGSGQGVSLRGLGAAVAMLSGDGAQGVVRQVQADKDVCIIEGTVDGLLPGKYRLAVHELGDLSKGCDSCGDVFNPHGIQSQNAAGDLGTVEAGKEGRAEFRLENESVKVWDVIGRSMVLHNILKEQQTGNGRVACGIVARSSGLFENRKRICACDGVTIWDEKNVPVAGAERSKHMQNKEQR